MERCRYAHCISPPSQGLFLLLGLFFYDAFFVFKSDAMLTVATQIEAPAKFLWAAEREAGDTRYPFSVLGLGDVSPLES